GQSFKRRVQVRLYHRLSQLRLESSNGQALGVAEDTFEGAGDRQPRQGMLFVAAIGNNGFTDHRGGDPRFSSNDAVEMAALLQRLGRASGFSDTHLLLLADDAMPATRSNIVGTLRSFLSAAGGDDTVVVFLASHGVSDANGNYFFVPHDGSSQE